ncbi:hypothetical protein [Streptomyces altiplanensis]
MPNKPITPSQIIPAGAPLPIGPPGPDDIPPWRTAPPPPAPPPAPPAVPVAAPDPPPQPVHVYVTVQPAYYEPDPEPTRRERLTAWLLGLGRPWQIAGALALALLPIPFTGYSAATTWAYTVSEARDAWGQGSGYALALTPLTVAVLRITRGGGTLRRLLLLAISLVGVAGAIDLYDPVTWITGVHPS